MLGFVGTSGTIKGDDVTESLDEVASLFRGRSIWDMAWGRADDAEPPKMRAPFGRRWRLQRRLTKWADLSLAGRPSRRACVAVGRGVTLDLRG